MISLRDVIARNAALYPDAIHSVCNAHRLTFGEFAVRVRRLSSGLYRLGLRHQDRVAILAMNCSEYLEVYGTAEWSGFVVATVNWRMAAPEIAYVLKDSAPRVLIFEDRYAAVVDSLRAELPHIVHWVCIGPETPPWAQAYESIVDADEGGAPRVARQGGRRAA